MKSLLSPDDALVISEELFRSMLPQCEAEFRREFEVWHPQLGFLYLREYLATNSYPRCWIVMAAIIFATTYTEYARLLLQSLRQRPDIVHEGDDTRAHNYDPRLLSLLNDESWRWALCQVGSHLYRGGPRSLARAFAVGLNFAFADPEAAQTILRVIRATAQRSYDWQVATAELVVRRRPISAWGREK